MDTLSFASTLTTAFALRDAINKLPSAIPTIPSAPSLVTQISFNGVPAATTAAIAVAGPAFSCGSGCHVWPNAKADPNTDSRTALILVLITYLQKLTICAPRD